MTLVYEIILDHLNLNLDRQNLLQVVQVDHLSQKLMLNPDAAKVHDGTYICFITALMQAFASLAPQKLYTWRKHFWLRQVQIFVLLETPRSSPAVDTKLRALASPIIISSYLTSQSRFLRALRRCWLKQTTSVSIIKWKNLSCTEWHWDYCFKNEITCHMTGSKIGVKIQGPPGPLEKKI